MVPVENEIPIPKKDAPLEGTVKIDLLGRQFQFRADDSLDDPEKVVKKLKQYVADAEQGVKGSGSVQNTVVILLLAGMNLANDLAVAESELRTFHDSVVRKSSDLLSKLNAFASNSG